MMTRMADSDSDAEMGFKLKHNFEKVTIWINFWKKLKRLFLIKMVDYCQNILNY